MANKIQWATQAMAQSYEIQKSLFPDFVNVADELALEWELALDELNDPEIAKTLSDSQKAAIKQLDNYMLSISGPNNIQYWNNEALCQSIEWKNMRRLASNILISMRWKKAIPAKNNSIYINNG